MPGGLAVGGCWHRTARLRPLCGSDEAFLEEEAQFLSPAARTTHLLTRCLESLGPLTTVTKSSVRELTVGDREALLLNLRRLTLGERISCVIACPEATCGEKMDLELDVRDLLAPEYAYDSTIHEVSLTEAGERYQVSFRLPNGADQEAAAAIVADDPEKAGSLILARCVAGVVSKSQSTTTPAIPAAVGRKLPQVMADLDPQAGTFLSLNCPACDCSFTMPFDIADYFYRECWAGPGNLYREVHLLALHYHWSEQEIMAMSRQKRRRYLNLLSDALREGRSR